MSRDSFLVIVIWGILCAIGIVVWNLAVDNPETISYMYYFNLIQIVTSGGASLLCYRTMMVFKPEDKTRTAWGFLSAGLLFWSIGAIVEAIYPLLYQEVHTPFPWYTDIASLMLVLFVLMSLITFKKSVNVNIPRWGWIVSIVVLFVAFGLAFLINMKGFRDLNLLALTVTMAYITLDSILLAMTMAIASILVGGIISHSWGFALAGLFIFYLGDIIYIFLRNIDQPNAGGIVLYLTWPISFGLIAIAATTAYTIYKEFE
ncbi:hypothetical protein [Candidatus Parabeggiatoa sp. HSG14]|uniref:hypothetical protein n=1 Tax=Candidatus Parabeggiatoa sp. HSG14 TaxID=3055593 RepID=UPI0025A7529C|nr:hypothetical protein [Thiotrichales bacterium HSG14]